MKHFQVAKLLSVAVWAALAQVNWAQAQVIANSTNEFSGVQGQDGWYYGYRDVTVDGKGIDYDANADFIPFDVSMWTGTEWDLDSLGAAPWTMLGSETVHPNSLDNGAEHWAIRRWVASELSGPTWVSVVWNVRKQNLSGNGVTGALHVNGARVQSAAIAGNDGTGATLTYFVRPSPTDKLDLILSPVGPTGATDDGADGSYNWMQIEILADTDGDSLPDAWENLYFPGDLTKLSGTGDFDSDGLTDGAEMLRSTDPTKADTDNDGLGDAVETNTGVYVSPTNTGTDPLKPDTDNDGRKDGDEVNGTPTTDPFDADSDDDTYLDGDEVATGHDPNNAADNPETTAIANSVSEFTTAGTQGENDWYYGYRNYTKDGGGENYNADTGFIAFDPATQWNGSMWDLDPVAENPWTELAAETTHPNSSTAANPSGYDTGVHWTIRRWVATEVTQVKPLAVRWHVRKSNTGGGNGVTGALYINGQRKDAVVIAGTDGTGIVHTYYANVAPADRIDLILSPRGLDGLDVDGQDSSATRFLVDPTIPAQPRQPDGTIFIPVGAGDTDADGLPDVWEYQYFPADLTKLTATGDYDQDQLSDTGEYGRDSDPTKPDTDGDGLTDLVETGTGIWVSTSDTGSSPKKPDTDGDGLTDGQEAQRVPPTDPNKADTDADGFTDAEEIAAGTDPLNPNDNPLTFVIANSEAEVSGTQGQNGWYNGYRVYDPVAGTVNYNPNQDFIPYPGGEGQGDWDGVGQTWNNGSWDLNTADAGPWTWQDALGIHPNGVNSPPTIGGTPDPNNEHWAIRRWVATELTSVTPVTVIWRVRKTNLNLNGVTGLLFINGVLADSEAIAGNDGANEAREYRTTLKNADIVDLALSPAGLNGDREDGADGSETWFRVDTRPWPADVTLSGVNVSVAQGQCTFRWNSQTGARYTVLRSSNLTDWTAIRTVDSTGTATSFTDDLGSPPPAVRFYRVSQP